MLNYIRVLFFLEFSHHIATVPLSSVLQLCVKYLFSYFLKVFSNNQSFVRSLALQLIEKTKISLSEKIEMIKSTKH